MEKNEERFDAVSMMRRIRDRMDREMEGMSYEEQKRYLSGVPRTRRREPSGDAERTAEQGGRR